MPTQAMVGLYTDSGNPTDLVVATQPIAVPPLSQVVPMRVSQQVEASIAPGKYWLVVIGDQLLGIGGQSNDNVVETLTAEIADFVLPPTFPATAQLQANVFGLDATVIAAP